MTDGTLLEPRTVLHFVPDADGLGFVAALGCGHTVWFSLRPETAVQCSVCLDQLVRQIADVQSHQAPVD